jgi:adenylate cyclase
MAEADYPPDAEIPAGLDVAALVERAEQILLGGPAKYTRGEVTERAQIDLDEGRRLWRALGFPSVGDDEVVFTDCDVEAIELVRRLMAATPMDDDLVRAMTRMLGQTFSRLASWQGQMVVEMLTKRPELLNSPDQLIDLVDDLTDVMQDIQAYVWRRQLAAYFARIASNASQGAVGEPSTKAVGFADMRNFTSLTRTWTEAQLREVLEDFESSANDIVGDHNGRVVKTIGDEVLFVADRPADAAAIALDLIDEIDAKPGLPPVRIGLAAGPVVLRFGDVYGSTVNIASRLTSLARPGSVLVDRVMAETLGNDKEFALRSKRAESVRGYHHLHQWRLRRADDTRSERHQRDERHDGD